LIILDRRSENPKLCHILVALDNEIGEILPVKWVFAVEERNIITKISVLAITYPSIPSEALSREKFMLKQLSKKFLLDWFRNLTFMFTKELTENFSIA
jgi:hypothetical protein